MLENEKIRLRPITKNDLNYLNKWKNDYQVFKYLGGGFRPTSIDVQGTWLDEMAIISEKNQRFIIENHMDNKPIGLIGLYNIHSTNKTCEVGIYIGEKIIQNKGIGSQAYRLLENYAINNLAIRKIKLLVVEENVSAYKFWEKQAFNYVGTYKAERFIDGKYKDVIIMEKILKD